MLAAAPLSLPELPADASSWPSHAACSFAVASWGGSSTATPTLRRSTAKATCDPTAWRRKGTVPFSLTRKLGQSPYRRLGRLGVTVGGRGRLLGGRRFLRNVRRLEHPLVIHRQGVQRMTHRDDFLRGKFLHVRLIALIGEQAGGDSQPQPRPAGLPASCPKATWSTTPARDRSIASG